MTIPNVVLETEDVPNPTIMGVGMPPNATVLGVGVDAVVERVRLAEGSQPRRIARATPPPPPVVREKSVKTTWQVFDRLGLRPKPAGGKAQKFVVSTYRLLGFAVLTIVVVALVAYIATTVFYMLNRTWISPVAISPNDDRVVSLRAQLTAEQSKRDQLAAELAEAERSIGAEQQFALQFARAIKHDLEGRKAELGRAKALATAAASARTRIGHTTKAYAKDSERRLADSYAAGLVDRRDMLTGKFQIAQIAQSNLSLAERQAELEQRAAELAVETKSLDAILTDTATDAAISYDVLRIKREYEASKLALAKAIDTRDAIQGNLARQDAVIASIKQSAYLRAVDDRAHIAFVPYSNLAGVTHGTRVYRCAVGMIWCSDVGSVLEVLPGEVSFQHPRREKTLRGQMVEVAFDDGEAAEDDVLFIGGAPLWL